MTLDQFKSIKDKLNVKQKWEILFRAHQQKLKSFVPKIQFVFEQSHYLVKTVDNAVELERTLRLRHEVFHAECLNKRLLSGLDFDRFDLLCDHLIIVDKRNDQLVGTYRVNCSLFSDQFYTSSEFNVESLLALPGVKLELGRACIEREYRTGAVIHLLWRAIAHYIKLARVDLLFGCASVFTRSSLEGAAIFKYLRDEGLTTTHNYVRPVGEYHDPDVSEFLSFLNRPEFKFDAASMRTNLPALFKSYLKMGGKICGEPGYDRFFECYDFVVLVELKNLNETVERKYGLS